MGAKFLQVLARAADAEGELRALEGDRAAWRLTAEGFLRAALELACCGAERVIEIERRMAERPGAFGALDRDIERVAREYSSGAFCEPGLRGLRGWASEDGDHEAAALGVTRGETLAVAIARLVERRPDLFGTARRPGQAAEQHRLLTERRDALLRQVAESWGAGDVVLGEVRRDGTVAVTLLATATAIGEPDWPLQAVRVVLARRAERDLAA